MSKFNEYEICFSFTGRPHLERLADHWTLRKWTIHGKNPSASSANNPITWSAKNRNSTFHQIWGWEITFLKNSTTTMTALAISIDSKSVWFEVSWQIDTDRRCGLTNQVLSSPMDSLSYVSLDCCSSWQQTANSATMHMTWGSVPLCHLIPWSREATHNHNDH